MASTGGTVTTINTSPNSPVDTPINLGPIWTVKEAAEWACVTPATIRRWGKAGRLRLMWHWRAGEYRVLQEQVKALINDGCD